MLFVVFSLQHDPLFSDMVFCSMRWSFVLWHAPLFSDMILCSLTWSFVLWHDTWCFLLGGDCQCHRSFTSNSARPYKSTSLYPVHHCCLFSKLNYVAVLLFVVLCGVARGARKKQQSSCLMFSPSACLPGIYSFFSLTEITWCDHWPWYTVPIWLFPLPVYLWSLHWVPFISKSNSWIVRALGIN